jgi:hypothetical protein
LKLEAMSALGAGRLKGTFVPAFPAGGPAGAHLTLEGDLAVVCRRGKPAYDVPYQLGGELSFQSQWGGFTPPRSDDEAPEAATALLPGGSRLVTVGEACGHLPARHDPSTAGVDKP